jgi:hypothetical protein
VLTLPEQEKILPLIQLSISPVILISGLGALVISMTTRMGRIVDRTRNLAGLARQQPGGAERTHIENQLNIMYRRAKLMRLSMTLVALSMFVSGLLIMLLFAGELLGAQLGIVILSTFALSVLFMLAGLAAFIRDVFVSLQALNAEVERALAHADEVKGGAGVES